MRQLQDLDQTRYPCALTHVDFNTLSDQEFRDALIAPSRHLHRCLKGEARYGRRTSIALPPLYHSTEYDITTSCTEVLKFAPGGRYLLVGSNEVIHIIDTRDGRCIWSRTAHSITEDDLRQRPVDIVIFVTASIDVCSDGSLKLLLLCTFSGWRDGLCVSCFTTRICFCLVFHFQCGSLSH